MTIYIATSGSYSDYCIEEVFTDKEQALIYCAVHGCELEEYEADRVKLDTSKPVRDEWVAYFNYEYDLQNIYKRGICLEKPPKLTYNPHRFKFSLEFTVPMDTETERVHRICSDTFAKEMYNAIEEGRYLWIKQHKED